MIKALATMIPWQATAAAVAVVVLLAGALVANGWRMDAQLAKQAEIRERQRADANADKVQQLTDARAEDARRIKTQTGIANDAKKELEQARADLRATGVVADKLRRRLAAIAAERRADDSATAGGGTAAGDPIGVLVDVLGRCEARERVVAEYADAARIAGTACERAYDALTVPAPADE